MDNCLNVVKTVNEDLDQMWSKIEKNTHFQGQKRGFGMKGGSIDTAVEFQSV